MDEHLSFLDQVRHRRVHVPKGRLIYDMGDPSTAFFRVESGCVRLLIHGGNGRRQIVAFLYPGDWFGLSPDEHPSAAEAVNDVSLIRYQLEAVLEVSTRSPETMRALLRPANRSFRDLAHYLEHVNHLPVIDRVLWFLRQLARRQGPVDGRFVPLPMSRRDIGDFLSIAPETLSRAFRDLQSQGVLAMKGRGAFVLNRSFSPRVDSGLGKATADRDGAIHPASPMTFDADRL